ncbi:hypothetical protein JOB18_019203 [Solea senegalensis]|uniref:Trichohyalin-like n=1 Tax=Solea senegalensis TaxID=28829 RepID=A0AAV6SFP1_SOLSE|nr:hypothetical protein JOB18_019203 [Solea senegalensis]
MDKSRDHVEAFPQEIRQLQVTAGPSSPGDAAEAWISQQPTPVPEAGTCQEQRGALFHTQEGETSQSRRVNIYQHLPSLEEHEPGAGSDERQQHSIDVKQLEDKETQVDMKTNREAVKRQRQLTRQMMEAVEQQWDESQTQRNEIAFLRTKTEQQHRDINRLTAENHEQFTATKALTLKMEKVIEKLKENKSEAAQEKMQLLKIQAEIDQERKTLDTQRCNLEMIKYGESKEESETHKVLTIKQNQEMTERLRADRLLRAIHEAKLAKEQLERSIKDINQELQISKNYISEHKSHIEDVKRNFNLYINKMKQKWTRNPSDSEMQRVPEVEQRVRYQERQDTSDSVRVKLGKIWEEMEKGWDALEDDERRLEMTVTEKLELKPDLGESTGQEMKANIEQDRKTLDRDRQLAKAEMDELKSMRESNERLKQELEERFQKTRREIRELEVLNNEIEMKKKELAKMIRLSKKNKEMKKETEHATQDVKDRQDTMAEQVETPEVNPAVMQKVIFDVQETRKLLHMIREDAQHRKRVLAEEVKWENFQQKKKKRKLEQWLEKTTKERDELEIMKIQMQRRREEDEQKHKDTITTLGMMGDVKDNIEKAVTEISNTREEMLKAQRQMEKNKDDVRTFMDKLSSLRAWASRWISTESAIRNSFSGNKYQLQTSQRATHRESHMEQTQEVPADEEHRVEGEIAQAGVSFQYRDKEHRHLFSVEKQSLYVQIQTEIYEETLIDDDLMTNLREREEMEKQIFRLRESEAELKEQIKSHMEVIEEKNQEIKNLILDIMELQRQRPEPEKDLVTNVERLLPETKSRDSLWGNRHEIDTYELAPQVPDENQKRNQETKSDLQTCREEIDGKDTTERRDLQSLRAEISRTQEIMRSIQLEVKTQPGNVDADKDPDYEEGEIEGLLQDIKEFQEFLRMVKKRLDEETGNMKSVKMGARKQKRELEQRLEKTLRERDTLDLLKIQMQKQSGVIEEKMERIAKVKSTMEKMAVKTRNKSDNIHCIIKECELNLRHLEEISFKFTATEHNFQTSYLSLTLLRAELENIKNQIRKDTGKGDEEKYKTEMDKPAKKVKYKALKLRVDKEELETYTTLIVDSCDEKNRDGEILQQQRDGETETGEIARQQAEAEKHLKESMERQRQELEDTAQTTKREIREMELLKSELEIKRKDCVRALRKLAIMRNEIQNEKGSLRRETKKKQRQLDQRLEKIMRERDELEVMKNKLQQEKNELCAQKIVKCKMANQSSEVINSQNTRQKLHILLEMIRRETEILKNMNVVLEKQTEGLKALQGENRTIRDNMNTIKLQIKTAFNKLTEQASAEMNQTVQMRDYVQKQRHDLDIRLEEVKRERRETEVLQTELEFKKRECQQMIRKGIRKHQEVKQMWDEIKEKKDAFKWETRKRKKELDQKLETIIREQDELEIMRLKLRREKDESEQQRTSGITNDENLLQNHWGLINICMEKCKDIKRHSEDLNEAIMEEKRNISAQGKIITEAKKDMELMKVNIKSKKGIMMHALKNMQQEQTHLEQLEMKDKSVSVKEKCVEEPEEGTMRDKDLEKENVFKAETFTVTIKEDKLLQIQKDEPQEMNKGEKKKSKKKIVVSDIVRQRQDMENQLESDALLEKADLVKLKAELDHEREDLERMNEMMNQEKMNLELMMSDIQRQNDQLQQDMKVEKEKLENAKTELQKTKEDNVKLFEEISQEKTNIKDLNVQVQEQRNNLEDVIGKMTLQQKEQELHDDTIRRLKQELETSEKSRLRERTELELLRENTNKTKEKVETAMSSINGERENLSHMKNEIEKEREKVLNEKENLEREGSELIRKEDEVLNKMKDIGILKVKLQQLNERMNDNIKQKTEILQQNKEDTLLLYTALEEQLTKLDGQKEKLVCFTELFGRDKDALISLMSDTVIQKEDIETQSKQKFMNEKLQLDKLKAELKEEREDLDRANEKMNNSKLEFERMKTDIKQQTDQLEQGRRDMEMTKTEIQKMKEHADSLFDEIKRDKTNINDLKLQVQEQIDKRFDERDELDILRKGVRNKKHEVEAAMKNIREDREHFNQMKADIDKEREILMNQKHIMEEQWSELKMRENEVMNEMKSMKSLKARLQQLNERISEDVKNKFIRLEQNKDEILKLVSVLKQNYEALDAQTITMTCFTEKLAKEREGLMSVMSEFVRKRQDIESQLEPVTFLEKEDLLNLKAELDQKREDMERMSEMMNQEKMDLELMRSDIQRQSDQFKPDINVEKEKLEIAKTELQKTQEHNVKLFEEISQEKTNIEDLKVQVQEQRNELEDVIGKMTLQQKEQELHDDTIRRLKQELETSENSRVRERTELELLRNEKDKLERENSELIRREDEVLNKMKDIEILKVKLQQLNERMSENIKQKTESLQQNKEDSQLLYTALEEQFTKLDGQKEKLVCFTELFGRDKDALISLLSDSVIQKEDIELKYLNEKLHLDKLKAELKEEREDLDRANEKMNNSKLEFEQMKTDIKQQTDQLEQGRRDMEMTKTERQKMKEHAESLFDEIKRDKTNINDLKLQVQEQIDKLFDERDELDILRKGVRNKKREVEAAMKNIREEREHFNQMKADIDKEREILMNQKHIMEEQWSELKMREDEVIIEFNSMKSLKARLQELNERISEDVKNKFIRLEQNKDEILKLVSVLKQNYEALDAQTITMTCFTEKLAKEREGLMSVLSEIVRQRQDMESQLEPVTFLEKEDLLNLKAELDQKREDMERMSEMMNQEKMDLELMRSDIQRQSDQFKHDINVEKEKLEITKTELQKRQEHNVKLFEEISQEKTNIEELKVQVQEQRKKLEDVIGKMTLQQKEQELHDDTIRRLKQELETSETSRVRERRELELLKNEKDKLERENSELIRREDEVLNKMKDIEILKVKLQQLNEKISENMKQRTESLQQNKEDSQLLYTALEEQFTKLDGQKEKLVCFTELFGRD